MRKTSTAGTVRRRVGMAALGAAAIAAVAVPGAAWANDDAAPVAQDHSVTIDKDGNADFREGSPATTKPIEVSPEQFQQMIADGQFRPATPIVEGEQYSNTKVLEVSAEELERMIADGEVVPATPVR